MSSHSNTQRALIASGGGNARISTIPIPAIDQNEILVRVIAVALNPVDNWHLLALKPGDSLGCDFSGVVVAVGSAAAGKGIATGDSVAGIVAGGAAGSFQEYLKTYPELVWKKPASLPYEDAAAMGGIALSTAAYALLYRLGVPKPWEAKISSSPSSILVWAASSSVGLFAVSLAKLSNIPIIATASPHNFDLVKNVGADAVFDYRDPEAVSKIKAWGDQHGGIPIALDCVANGDSTKRAAQSLSSDGRVMALLDVYRSGDGWPPNVTIDGMSLYGVFNYGSQDFNIMKEWNSHITRLIESEKLGNGNPLKIMSGGLYGIPEGLVLLGSGKISAQKLIYKLA